MDVKKWILGLTSALYFSSNFVTEDVGVVSVAQAAKPYTKVPTAEKKSIIGLTNKARRRVAKVKQPPATKMMRVTWDRSLEKDLKNFIANTQHAWFFWKNQTESRYNAHNLMAFEPFKSKYGDSLGFFIHDGCQSSPTAIRRIFYYRTVNQQKCFNYAKCENSFIPRPGSINTYQSCNAYPIILKSNMKCSWFWQYYPRVINDNVKSIACALLGYKGPNAAGGYRPNHFICYYRKVVPTNEAQIDVPYTAGKACSECPPDTKCHQRLCV